MSRPCARTITALNAVPTADEVLIDGRGAWRSVRRMSSRFAAFPRMRICSVMSTCAATSRSPRARCGARSS